jgi:hypothetical protein
MFAFFSTFILTGKGAVSALVMVGNRIDDANTEDAINFFTLPLLRQFFSSFAILSEEANYSNRNKVLFHMKLIIKPHIYQGFLNNFFHIKISWIKLAKKIESNINALDMKL